VPEFNTPFVRGVLEATRPKTVDDLIRISGLTHGTGNWFDNADNLIRSGTATLRDVVGARDDIMLTLIEKGGDRKWAFEVMERVRKGKGLREEDIAEMRRLGLPEWYIESLKKIVYLFPRAHAAAYTVMSLRIAWFKVYYPVAFYCAVLSKKNSISHKYYFMSKQELVNELLKRQADKTPQAKAEISDIELIFDAKAHGIKFYAPDVTVSDSTNFLPYEDGIILPLVAIDGVGTTLAENIVTERSIRRFTSKEDFVQRCKPNKKQLAVLEEAGALRNLQNRQITLFA
jgi:DNA polymerase-3 subunit alpha (Gram-positive type)